MKSIISFTLKQHMLHHLILHAFQQDNIGLLNGRMGTAVTLCLIGRSMEEKTCIDLAEKLLDSIVRNIKKDMSIYFSNGLCGICWGIDFLLNEGFFKGNSAEICSEMDKAIMQINPARLDYSLEYGILGLLHYVLAHLTTCKELPFDNSFMNSLYHSLTDIPWSSNYSELQRMGDIYRNYYKSGPLEYSFNIRDFIKDVCAKVTEQNFQQIGLSLSTGVCGRLLNSNEE